MRGGRLQPQYVLSVIAWNVCSSCPVGKAFHTRGPAAEKLLSPKLFCMRGTTHIVSDADRSWGRPVSAMSWMSEARYVGVCPANNWCTMITKKVKASHTRYRALGPELIPVYRHSSPQVIISHSPGDRLPLLSARPAVTFPAAEHRRPLADTKLYCLVTEAHRCKQLAQGCYAAFASNRMWTHDLLIVSAVLHRATLLYCY